MKYATPIKEPIWPRWVLGVGMVVALGFANQIGVNKMEDYLDAEPSIDQVGVIITTNEHGELQLEIAHGEEPQLLVAVGHSPVSKQYQVIGLELAK